MSVDNNSISGLPKRTVVLISSIVVIILFVIVVFIIPNFQYIGGVIGINSPVVAKVNGQVLTVNDLINFNCNRYNMYDPVCKTKSNYMKQLQNFINYTIEYQYLESHKQLPTQKEVYGKVYNVYHNDKLPKEHPGNQLYDYYYQKLVLDNIGKILLKHSSGYVFLISYSFMSLMNKEPMSNAKNIAKNLINSWYKSLDNNTGNVKNLYNKAFNYYSSHKITSYVVHYNNINAINAGNKIMFLAAGNISGNIINILKMKNNSISKIYDYYSNNVPISLGGHMGYYYFVVSQNVTGNYIDYNSMITNLRSKSNILIY
ncbi:hypothetical protein M1145_00655 [Patescibacteria group bacterium]|nr:hypothetical protein [Patescibacteria group bacterium]